MYRTTKQSSAINSAKCDECGSTRTKTIFGELRCDDCGHVIINIPKRKPKHRKKMVFREKVCAKCEQSFMPVSGVQKWCYSCTSIKCKQCDKEIRVAGTMAQFCSKKCVDEFRKGKKLTNYKPLSKQSRERVNNAIRAKFESADREAYIAKISASTKIAMQRPEVQAKIRATRTPLTLERRMEISDNLAGKMPANLGYSNNSYKNIQRGYYDINGTTIYFRSKWEANYALYLDWLMNHGEIVRWEFEPDTFMFEAIKLGTRSYTPDFKVYTTEHDYTYHEVKGYFDSKSKTKLKRFKKYYPSEKLLLIDGDTYRLLAKQIGKLCKFY